MRKNYYLTDVVMKAKGFGFTDEEIMEAVRTGINNFESIKKQVEKENTKKEKKAK